MRRGNLTEGSNPSLSATNLQNTDKIGLSNILKIDNYDNYDDFSKKAKKSYASLRLYRVNNIYYYRRNINKKCYRLSLKTKDFKKSIFLKRILDLLNSEEFKKMFELKDEEFEILLKYQTDDDLDRLEDIIQALRTKVKYTQQKEENAHFERYKQTTFGELEVIFLKHQQKLGKVSESSFKMYRATFNYLKKYFKGTYIQDLRYVDVEAFQDYLIRAELNNKTINNHMTYFKMFLELAVKKELIERNVAERFDTLRETKTKKENFNDEEIIKIFNETKDDNCLNDLFKVLAFSGMRISEALSIGNISTVEIDQKTKIKYFNLKDAKTEAGIRKIPMHISLYNVEFPIFIPQKNQTFKMFVDSVNKVANRKIHKIIPDKLKTCHTFRASFIQKLVNNFPEKILIIKQIVGHSQNENALTLDTYAKEFDIILKDEILQTVDY